MLLGIRFWKKVNKTKNCWNWIGALTKDGYGLFNQNYNIKYAHRLSWEDVNGTIPDEMTVDHLCRNRKCINPDHMDIVSRSDNVMRGDGICAKNSRKTHCKRGHLLKKENLQYDKSNPTSRVCKKCRQIRRP